MRAKRFLLFPALFALSISSLACAQGETQAPGTSIDTPATEVVQAPAVAQTAVLVGAGDIANCEVGNGHEATALLLDQIPGTIFTAGDHAYPKGSARSFADCYARSWGRHKARTRPSLGNHDLMTNKGAAYYDYFGSNAGPRKQGFYSYQLGAWHIISLNSEAPSGRRSAQIDWLRKDLAANPATCTLAYWHVPVFSSGSHGSNPLMAETWRVLQEFGADVIVNGHDHVYERFAPQDAGGKADPERGIREFIVGTGGAGLYAFKGTASNSEVRQARSYGVIKFTLHADAYDWEFVSAAGSPFEDKGSARCVGAPALQARNAG